MKKILFLLGLMMLMFAASAPRVDARDNDVGAELRAQSAEYIAVADIQTVDLSFESVTVIATRDPGSLSTELSAQSTGLREESPAYGSLTQGDVTFNDFFRNRQCARVYTENARHNVTPNVISTSCGGIGY